MEEVARLDGGNDEGRIDSIENTCISETGP